MSSVIYRYKFSEIFLDELKSFIDIHRFDDIPIFKEAWDKWCIDNIILINDEKQRLDALGYKNDVRKKMYMSARYYYKNKFIRDKKQKKRKTYIRLDLETLSLMDAHIGRDPQKPSLSYANFIENYSIQIRQLTSSLIRDTGLNKEDISKKLKKTFKNRYFRLSRK